MTPRLGNIMWMSLVRSVIEYGSEIWGERPVIEFDKLQQQMGKRILRCSSRTSEEVVRGELGWERQIARRDEMRLRYWARLIRMDDNRIAKQVYRGSRMRLEREEREGKSENITDTWCIYTRKLMCELNLHSSWNREFVPCEDEWNEIVRERIHEREQEEWRRSCLSKAKLRTYCILKQRLRTEPYLQTHFRGGIPELAKLRGGTNRLRIEQGRYRKEELEQRVCECCESKEIEDEKHFVLRCRLYNDLREDMWKKYEEITGEKKEDCNNDEDKMLNVLIGDKHQPDEKDKDKHSWRSETYQSLVKQVMKYITLSMNRRRRHLE